MTTEEKTQVQKSLQKIYNLADSHGRTAWPILDEVIKINEALQIEIIL